MLESLRIVVEANEEKFRREALLERLVEPERQFKFRVPWVDDKGQVQVNTGYACSSTARSDRIRETSSASICEPWDHQIFRIRAGI